MALTGIIKEIQKLNIADQLRLKEFFTKTLAAASISEPIFKEVSEQKHK
ncbi:IS1595 family transposase, partial [Bacillus sp. JJ1764]